MARKPTEGYVQLVNSYFMNWKVRRLRESAPTALGVFSMVLSYCGFKLSDGWITYNDLRYVIGASDEEINALCGVEMLVRDETGDNFMVHDYLRHNRSCEQVTKKRGTNSANKASNDAESVLENAKTSAEAPLLFPDSDDTVQKSAETSAEAPKNDAVSGQTTELQNNKTTEHSSFTPPAPSSKPEPETDEEYSMDFEQFWAVYPRKEGKRAAFRSFQKARRKTNKMTLIAKASRYAADPNRDPAFTLKPANWLDDEHWLDDPLPARSSPPQSAFVKPQTRSQANFETNAANTWKYMTPEERARYQQEGNHGLIEG